MICFLREKKKRKTERLKTNTSIPNNMLYLMLLIGATVLTALSLFVEESKAAYTIWTSISCGAIASVLVAWLIDVANCRREMKKILKNRETLFANFYHTFSNGIQLLVFECACIDKCNDSKRWYEWVSVSYELATLYPDHISSLLRSLMIFIDDVEEQIIAIKGQEATMLDAGIIFQDDIEALSTMKNLCDFSKTTYNSKISNIECFEQIKTNLGIIRGLLGYAPSLQPIKDMMVEPILYRVFLNEA